MELLEKEYAIYLFEFDGIYLMYDMCSGSIYELSEQFYYQIKDVIKSGIIPDNSALKNLFEYNLLSNRFKEERRTDTIHTAFLSFAPEYNCNLRCSYCFGECGEKYAETKRSFNEDDVKHTIDYFISMYPNAKQYRIDFVSGGEPLLKFDIVQNAISYAEYKSQVINKKISIWLCTNGLLLDDDKCKYLSEHDVSIGISLDGRKEHHDKNRVDHNGYGTYDRVIKIINKIHESNELSHKFKNIWGLCTASADNSDFVDIIQHFSNLGFNNLQIRLVRDDKNIDLQVIESQYKRLTMFIIESFYCGNEKYIDMILNDNDQFGKVLKRIFLGKTVTRRCDAGINKITLCPNGDIYPCDSLVGWKECKIGEINNLVLDRRLLKNTDVFTRNKCQKCNINILCGGDCYHNAYKKNGNIHDVSRDFCELQRIIIQDAIYIKYVLMQNKKDDFEKYINKLMLREEYRALYG